MESLPTPRATAQTGAHALRRRQGATRPPWTAQSPVTAGALVCPPAWGCQSWRPGGCRSPG